MEPSMIVTKPTKEECQGVLKITNAQGFVLFLRKYQSGLEIPEQFQNHVTFESLGNCCWRKYARKFYRGQAYQVDLGDSGQWDLVQSILLIACP
eukprot:maker-scaffold77_size404793-snap-gene-3.26 protein:Tk04789 transcript:maker-scaffold77_size404793-snap-gene-3.26-mRNA-1 annotation:"udp pyrophosphate synthase"